LYGSFCRWAGLAHNADVEKVFANELRGRGFVPDADGFVAGLIVIEDFVAALRYERSGNRSSLEFKKSEAVKK
jgi:hypothetical protein